MSRLHTTLLVASLTLIACENKLADRTEQAAERVKKQTNHVRHERHELSREVAERADDRAANRDVTKHVGEIAEEVGDLSREAGRLAQAQNDYVNLRALRVASLRAEHSVAASQPLLIQVIANAKALLPHRHERLDATLVIFRQRLAETRKAIEELQYVPAAEWERRDDELAHAMAGMFLARDASWHLLDDNYRDENFLGT